jgi:hypothetical protein
MLTRSESSSETEYKDFNDHSKIRNNRKIVEISQMYLKKTLKAKAKAIIFDGQDGYTSTILSRIIDESNITVVEKAKKTAFQLRKKFPRLQVQNVYLSQLLRYSTIFYQNIAYFDYMGSGYGSHVNDEFPMRDIHQFLVKNINDRLVLAVTFSLRSPFQKYYSEAVPETFYKEMVETFTESGYRMIYSENPYVYQRKLPSSIGNGTRMVFYIFVLQKDKIEAEFAVIRKGKRKILEFFGEELI